MNNKQLQNMLGNTAASTFTYSTPLKNKKLFSSLCLDRSLLHQISQGTIIPHVLSKYCLHQKKAQNDNCENYENSHTTVSDNKYQNKMNRLSVLVIIGKLEKLGRAINSKEFILRLKTLKIAQSLSLIESKTRKRNLELAIKKLVSIPKPPLDRFWEGLFHFQEFGIKKMLKIQFFVFEKIRKQSRFNNIAPRERNKVKSQLIQNRRKNTQPPLLLS